MQEAFWTTAETVAYDSEAQMLFLLLLRQNNNVPLLFDDVKKIEMMAWQDNPYMMYAYARLHDVLQYDNHSDSIKHDFYKLAASHGIGDAYAQLAYMHKDGDLGECDYDAYNHLMQKALDHHSEKAMQQHIRDIIYGTNGSPRDALKGYELAENHVHQQDFHDPEYYMLMGDADRELGRIGNAVTNYELATEHGGSAAFFWWAVTDCCDRDGIVVDRDGFAEIMQKGRAVDARDCYLMYTMLTDDATYEALDPRRPARTQRLSQRRPPGRMVPRRLCLPLLPRLLLRERALWFRPRLSAGLALVWPRRPSAQSARLCSPFPHDTGRLHRARWLRRELRLRVCLQGAYAWLRRPAPDSNQRLQAGLPRPPQG